MSTPSVFDCATLVGETVRQVISYHGSRQPQQAAVDFTCNFLVGGQIAGERPRLFLVYPGGQLHRGDRGHAFFQIGENKYGKPIIDRVVKPSTPLAEAMKCAAAVVRFHDALEPFGRPADRPR